jgi:hypothetical protein
MAASVIHVVAERQETMGGEGNVVFGQRRGRIIVKRVSKPGSAG